MSPLTCPQRPETDVTPSGGTGRGGAQARPYLSAQLDHVGLHLRVGLVELLDVLVQLLDVLVVVDACGGDGALGLGGGPPGARASRALWGPEFACKSSLELYKAVQFVCPSMPTHVPPYSQGPQNQKSQLGYADPPQPTHVSLVHHPTPRRRLSLCHARTWPEEADGSLPPSQLTLGVGAPPTCPPAPDSAGARDRPPRG